MDRVLTDETRTRIMRAYRQILSAPGEDLEEIEVTEDLPLGVNVLHLQRFEDYSIHAEVYLDHGDGPTLVTDEVEDCPHHTDGDELSTLAALGDEYAQLEKDLMEVSALMCDLPEYEAELEEYAIDRAAFQNLFCYDGLLTFTFGFHVADVIVEAYQDYEHELGEQLGIPIDPSAEELVENEADE
jgi:hypothetical protein